MSYSKLIIAKSRTNNVKNRSYYQNSQSSNCIQGLGPNFETRTKVSIFLLLKSAEQIEIGFAICN